MEMKTKLLEMNAKLLEMKRMHSLAIAIMEGQRSTLVINTSRVTNQSNSDNLFAGITNQIDFEHI
jgi:hypothetical protein